MDSGSVTVDVVVDAKIFRQFYMFENFVRRRGAFYLALFAGLMTIFASVVYVIDDGVMLGSVLLAVGLGYPLFHIWRIFRSVNAQIRVLDLEVPKVVYSLRFTEEADGVEVKNHGGGDDPLVYQWDSLHEVHRLEGCIYLYVHNDKAFLLPDGQAKEGVDALWDMLFRMVPREKLRDRRKKKKR